MNNLISVIEFKKSQVKILIGYRLLKKIYVVYSDKSEEYPVTTNPTIEKERIFSYLSSKIYEIKNKYGEDIFSSLIVLFPNDGFSTVKVTGSVNTFDPSLLIVKSDYKNCVIDANKKVDVKDKVVLYDDPYVFFDDNNREFTSFPLGQRSDKLTFKGDAQLMDERRFNFYTSILEELSLSAKLSLFSSFAGHCFIRNQNCINLEINDFQSDISLIRDSHLISSASLPIGSKYAISEGKRLLKGDFSLFDKYALQHGFLSDVIYDYKDKTSHSIREYNQALKDGFSLYLEKIYSEIEKMCSDSSVSVFLYGDISKMTAVDTFFKNMLKRPVFCFESKVIGARGGDFINCIGAINISSYPYISLSEKKALNKYQLRG